MPDSLLRTIIDPMILGIHELDNNQMFIVFKIEDHQTAYKGMFDWEKDMNSDLAPLFGPDIKKNYTTSNASTKINIEFEDDVVSNVETRELHNSNDKPIILWAMPNETTIIITTSRKTMRALIERVIVST
jgi:hypothetical protein